MTASSPAGDLTDAHDGQLPWSEAENPCDLPASSSLQSENKIYLNSGPALCASDGK